MAKRGGRETEFAGEDKRVTRIWTRIRQFQARSRELHGFLWENTGRHGLLTVDRGPADCKNKTVEIGPLAQEYFNSIYGTTINRGYLIIINGPQHFQLRLNCFFLPYPDLPRGPQVFSLRTSGKFPLAYTASDGSREFRITAAAGDNRRPGSLRPADVIIPIDREIPVAVEGFERSLLLLEEPLARLCKQFGSEISRWKENPGPKRKKVRP